MSPGAAGPPDPMNRRRPEIKDWIAAEATALGFDVCRVAATAGLGWEEKLSAWLAAGHQAGMGWMRDRSDQRAAPSALWPEARSAIVLGMNYGPDSDPLATLARAEVGTISVYARGRDYHKVLKGKLKHLAQKIEARTGAKAKVFVDTAPLMEKPLAEAAGLGWQGKHTVLVSRELGNWLFLGCVFTTLELAPDAPAQDACGSCTRCLSACPTDAFPAPYLLDSRRCISYLTIEHEGHIDRELRPLMGNRIYGCDDCLAVCPWNKFAEAGREAKLRAREDLNAPPLAQLLALDDVGFRAMFSASPIKRTGRDRFMRNVLIAAGNAAPSTLSAGCERITEGWMRAPGQVALLLAAVLPHLADPNPIIRAAAVWALSQLDPARASAMKREARATEGDADVAAEWDALT
jgi:epoxyqueuosine reductase